MVGKHQDLTEDLATVMVETGECRGDLATRARTAWHRRVTTPSSSILAKVARAPDGGSQGELMVMSN